MGESESEPVLDLLGDFYSRQILAHLSDHPMVVEEIETKCKGSKTTIYERVDQLKSLGLIHEKLMIDPNGHHRKQYETILNSVLVKFHNGKYEVQVDIREDAPNQFAGMWRRMRGE